MKIKIKTIPALCLLGLSLATGCKKDKTGTKATSVTIVPAEDNREKKPVPIQIGTNDKKILFTYTPARSLSKIEYNDGKSTVLSYDRNGRPLAFMHYQGDKLISSTEYQLDENGLVIRGDQFSSAGGRLKASGYYTLSYTAGKQLSGISCYDLKDNLTGTQQKEYNPSGNLVLEKNSSAELTASYSYDDRKGIFKNVNYAWLFALEKESSLFLSAVHNIGSSNYPKEPTANQSFSYIYNTDQYPENISTNLRGKTTNDKVIYQQIE